MKQDPPIVTLHGLKACDTCRKALREVRASGRTAVLRDFRAEPPSRDEVGRWHAELGDALLNRRSTTWRGLTEAERAADPIDLMVRHPTLIKRPVVQTDDGPSIGRVGPQP
ncbi:arsenate reductase [Jannaschia sp. S6380]|uniref:arsenate reductase family protein n=1 Tax=Jannaschia sp. S6380 TaxID=2926408 RepID=UPI001FF14C41|nr:ArsC/Spx/MgsR family protein [Jannaschia sp. S6380]MCK0167489.1 arsenate reductase [Jannaschia sp. S6380]